MNLPPKAARRANETRDLVVPIIAALNHLDGVRVTRNNNLGPVAPWSKRFDPRLRPMLAGLGLGSADIVGIVTVPILVPARGGDAAWYHCEAGETGRVFALEVKRPGEGLRPEQRRWLGIIRKLGGFGARVESIEQALAAVERCRKGEDQ